MIEGVPVGLTYFKRYRMELDLTGPLFPEPEMSPGYRFLSWHDSLLDAHAQAKYQCFRFELDANVFPCLGERQGCRRLMNEIARRDGFLSEATWLLEWNSDEQAKREYCGTIQGIRAANHVGSVQNLGITPTHRGQQLGTLLLHKALEGFQSAGMKKASLEVTAQNTGAVRLYHRLGFNTVKTVYKAAEVVYA